MKKEREGTPTFNPKFPKEEGKEQSKMEKEWGFIAPAREEGKGGIEKADGSKGDRMDSRGRRGVCEKGKKKKGGMFPPNKRRTLKKRGKKERRMLRTRLRRKKKKEKKKEKVKGKTLEALGPAFFGGGKGELGGERVEEKRKKPPGEALSVCGGEEEKKKGVEKEGKERTFGGGKRIGRPLKGGGEKKRKKERKALRASINDRGKKEFQRGGEGRKKGAKC